MNSVPVVGRQALYLQNMGENLAIATQEGRAPTGLPVRIGVSASDRDAAP